MTRLRDWLASTTIDQRINALLVAVAVVTLGVVLLILPTVTVSADNIQAQTRSDQITACRAAFRAEIDQAREQLYIATAESDDVIRRGLAAVAAGDDDLLADLVLEGIEVDQDIRAAITRLSLANEAYARAVDRSVGADQEAFLDDCRG